MAFSGPLIPARVNSKTSNNVHAHQRQNASVLKNKFVHKAATLVSIDKRAAMAAERRQAEKLQHGSRFYAAAPERDFTRLGSEASSTAMEVYQQSSVAHVVPPSTAN